MFEKLNRPFTYFVDLTNCDNYEFSHEYISPIYYLENQKRINPNTDNTLAEELCEKVSYWLVNGPGTCGKTAAAKYIAS